MTGSQHDQCKNCTVPKAISLGPKQTVHRVSKKNCAKLFLLELRHISTNFYNFWQEDGKEVKIMRGALIFHLT